jgi:hypothetical protein
MEDVGIFFGHLVTFPAIWDILCPFKIFPPVLVHFTNFGMLYQEKSGNLVLFSFSSIPGTRRTLFRVSKKLTKKTFAVFWDRIARFNLEQYTKTVEIIPKLPLNYQMAI